MTASDDKPTILVVDDELGPRESLRIILTPKYNVVTTENGRQALDAMDEVRPEMVISDIRMPQMTGTELLREVKRRDPHMPVVLITGYATVQTAQEAVRAGAYDYINKPYDVKEIERIVENALAENTSRRERETMMNTLQQWNRELESQIGQLDKKATLGELSAELIHDLNNPMSVLRGYIGLLEDSLTQASPEQSLEQQREFLEIIKNQIEKCVKLTRNFLDFARSPSENWSDENVNDLIVDTIFVLRVRLQKQNIEIQTKLDPDVPRTLVMATPLQQTIYNIISNAADAMAEKKSGHLVVATSTEELNGQNCVKIIISDNGSGIAQDTIEKIFTPFFTTKDKKKGTGLGLAISKRVVDQHKGLIEARNKPDGGAEFAIHIPLKHEHN